VPANDPLTFELSTSVQSASNETASVRFAARISNQSGRPITFPGGLKISLTVTPSSGAKFVVQLDAPSVTGLASGEQVTASSVQDVSGYGRFDVVGSCEVDYGS